MAGQEGTPNSLLTKLLEYERSWVNVDDAMVWYAENWTHILWISALYIVMVFGGARYMSSRPPFSLRGPLAVWSGILAVYSIIGTVRTAPELFQSWFGNSFQNSVCNPSFYFEAPTAFWAYGFPFSKVLELGDTAFLVLRKRPVIFLHWYHHVTVMTYCFFTYSQSIALGRYFMTLNFAVHSLMYTYYTLKAVNVWIPKWISMLITLLQLSQMVVGVFINVKAYLYLGQGHQCASSYKNIFWAFLMYASYLVLFAQFFYNAYLKPRPSKVKVTKSHENGIKYENGFYDGSQTKEKSL